MFSKVEHPNVFDDYICASILNTQEGYTSAYTLKGICIQLLSFFGSELIEQEHGGGVIKRRDTTHGGASRGVFGVYKCTLCGFGQPEEGTATPLEQDVVMDDTYAVTDFGDKSIKDLPPELLLLICDELDEEALLLAAQAWNGFSRVVRQHNIIRTRELQCFTLKEGFNKKALGVGVHVEGRTIQSEFDLMSYQAFTILGVRRSVQGLPFEHWLPLPISQTHWIRARRNIDDCLDSIARTVGISGPLVTVIYAFMNDTVVRLSQEASDLESVQSSRRNLNHLYLDQGSTLTVVSEKAIESYFHLFHVLLCLAIEQPGVAKDANNMIKAFLDGKRDKKSVPNLGHLLVMVLISDTDVTDELTRAIVKEAITRNVVWMLDVRGQNMPELSFVETDATSDYRLQKTFDAGKTSYRLLMFANMMKRCVTNTSTNGQPKTLAELRDDLFKRHGGAPHGTVTRLADAVRKIQKVSSFPDFLKAMGIQQMPAKPDFAAFLRRTVQESVEKGYSTWALTQEEALALRIRKEPEVGRVQDMQPANFGKRQYTFFPQAARGRRR
ncbi:hypothetical protein LTR37_000836 [Vermiconidia calcicola]|uniref:Uncharacterized protein n=1 Tax=Vermiconidia calcicola TaxID=1690605 RepID=A0ACC3NYG3_9PEZI|nr:hypothetical protein LTR37_000836 [Vermiconidia calcicola]